ncbi:MAG: tetratricopeptide repeat protein [Pirellulaceae bacterium]|nr:tetratricopeptide repeat protein [Pirellulaceae bacterium]
MNQKAARYPSLLRAYQVYLTDANSPQFVAAIANQYSLDTLYRLVDAAQPLVRRASVLAIGMLGDIESIEAIGPLLCDHDRRVRLVADDAIKSLWNRASELRARFFLEKLLLLIEADQMQQALAVADDFIEYYPELPEGYCRRALVHFNLGNIYSAIDDCQSSVRLSRFGYMAYVGLGQCYLEQDEPHKALAVFRQALSIYPDLETVRIQVKRLERMLREMT